MSPEIPQPSSDNAMEFFTDPRSYRRFSTTRDNRRIFGCVEPRFLGQVKSKARAHRNDYKVTVQTEGGGIGLGVDRALRVGVETGKPITMQEGVEREAEERIVNLLDAHHECKFEEAVVPVLGEMANPSDFTKDAIDRWDDRVYRIGLTIRSSHLLTDAILRQIELQQSLQGSQDLLKVIDNLHPDHPNVRYAAGENKASLHVVNHHSFVGIDRRRQENRYGESAQGYHSNLAAVVERSLVLPDLSPRGRQLRAAAAIWRAAATRTVLMAGNSNSQFLEVFPDPNPNHGLRFEEIAA